MKSTNLSYCQFTSNTTFRDTLISISFTGKGPRKGWRTPLNTIICSEQRDTETGYGYFGARYLDHELTTMWLSVDPMSDKYPSISPYAYCVWNRPTGGHEHRLIKSNIVNNPVRLMDPDGNDWYQNKLTGAIYFNSEYKGAGDAGKGKMEGKGWMRLGGDDMFMDGKYDFNNSGLKLAMRYGKVSTVPNNPFDISGKSGIHLSGELMLCGEDAESFMNSYGYKKMPLLAMVNVKIVTQNISEGDGSVYVQRDDLSYVSKVYSTTYVKNPPRNPVYLVKKATPWNDDINIVRSISSRTEIRQYDYSRGNNWDIIATGISLIARFMSSL